MKIGILTVPFNNNYGGYLQSFALMTILKRMGHEPTLVMRRHDKSKSTWKKRLKYFLKGIMHTIKSKSLCPLIYKVEGDYEYLGSNMHEFVEKWIQPLSPYLYSTDELKSYCHGSFDAYIVGSDQVWRSIYVPQIGNYFLDFTYGWHVKRIAYAASFGTDNPEYTNREIEVCRCLVRKFDAVSLREESGKKVFEKYNWSSENLQVVLDPTLLLSADDYKNLVKNETQGNSDYIFYYVLDKNVKVSKVLDVVSTKLNLPLSGISNIQQDYKPLPSIEFWLSQIMNSSFVVTDSFHGMVFSIIFNKPFVVLVNERRGADRFVSLLSILGLEERMIMNIQNLNRVFCHKVDWSKVNCILNIGQKNSISFIDKSLSDIK